MPLVNLPNEIILCIAEDHLSDASDVLSLFLTCRRFANVLPTSIERLAATKRYVRQAICVAAAYQREDKLEVLVQKARELKALDFIEEHPESMQSAQKPSKCPKQLVRYILDQGANLAIREFFMWGELAYTTLLHFAVWSRYVGMVETLLANGAKTEKLDANECSALQLATSITDTPVNRLNAIVKLLLEHGADAAAESEGNMAPIALAVRSGNTYQFGLMPNQDTSQRFSVQGEHERWGVLHLAADGGWLDIARILIEKGADPNMPSSLGTPLHHAVQRGSLELAEFFIDKGSLIDERGYLARTPLHLAVRQRREEMVNLLLDRGASINLVDSSGCTALHHLAKGHQNPQLIKLLVGRGADPTIQNDQGETPLHVAIGSHKGANVKTILDLTPEKCLSMRDNRGNTPLYAARCAEGVENFVLDLLLRDPDIEFLSRDATPALQIAVKRGDIDLMKRILARHGPKHPAINEKDRQGRTALHIAAKMGAKAITELLVANGIDISCWDRSYQTALHHAAGFSAGTTEILLAAGASVDARDINGRTPLHYASEDATAHLLIEWGADVTIKDNFGAKVPDRVSNWSHSHAGERGS